MNNTICELVSTTRGQAKINVNGYLLVKDKNRNNSFYWCCEKRGTMYCNGRAVTRLVNGQHHLQKTTDHNHGAEASRLAVIKAVNTVKKRARETSEPPAQIVQTVTASTSREIHPYLPSCNALCQSVKRLRRSELPAEPMKSRGNDSRGLARKA